MRYLRLIKGFSLFVVLALCVVQVSASFAVAPEEGNRNIAVSKTTASDGVNIYCNEYEQIELLKQKTDQELLTLGMTSKDIEDLRSFNFEAALYERAQLPDEELFDLGYTQEQISLLRNYNGEELTSDNPVMRAVSVPTGAVTIEPYGTDIIVKYSWNWTAAPVNYFKDIVAVHGRIAASNSNYIMGNIVNKIGTAYYSETKNGTKTNVSLPTSSPSQSPYEAVSASFNVRTTANSTVKYAFSGFIQMRIEAAGSNASSIGACQAYGAYGHSNLTASPQVSFDSTGMGFSFTPALRVTTYPAGPVIWEG